MTDARLDFLMLTLAQVREAAVPSVVYRRPPAPPPDLRDSLKTTWN